MALSLSLSLSLIILNVSCLGMLVFGIVVKSNEKKVTVFRRDSVIFCFGYERGNKDVDEL